MRGALTPSLQHGIKYRMGEMRKITAILPVELIDSAMEVSRSGLTETIREALRDYNHHAASERILGMRGKLKFEMDWRALRDKDEA